MTKSTKTNAIPTSLIAPCGMSKVENLRSIEASGIRSFIRDEKQKWTCPMCDDLICVDKPQWLTCGRKWH